MSRQISFLVIIAICMILIGLTQTTPLKLNKRLTGNVAYCDFTDPTGRITFTDYVDDKSHKKCRMIGEFTNDFKSHDIKKYEFLIEDKKGHVKHDLTNDISDKITGNGSGSSPFQVDFPAEKLSVSKISGEYFHIKFNKKTVVKEKIIRIK
jgi:hypothetical protein